MDYQWYDLVENIGVLLVLGSYFLLQLEKIDSRSLSYNLCNALGAGFILISLYFEFNLSAFVIEFFWLLGSLYGFFKLFRRRSEVCC